MRVATKRGGATLAAAGLLLTASQPSYADARNDYESLCTACHGFGIAGAPVLGDAADWTSRLDKGIDQVYENAIRGFSGERGVMPPKGGFSHLTDQQIRAIVDYMVEQSRAQPETVASDS